MKHIELARLVSQAFWLARFDLRSLRRERGLIWLLLTALALALFALAQGVRFQGASLQAAQAAVAREDRALSDAQALAQAYFAEPTAARFAGLQWWRTAVDIRGYAFREHVGFAVKPALPGAALAIAQADVLPAYVRVRAETLDTSRSAYEIEHPARLAAGRFDLQFFTVYLWPLVLLALGSSVLTQDRENRRLPTLQLQGVAAWRLLLVQTLARCLGATLLLVLVVGVAAITGAAVPNDASGWAALTNWASVVIAYALFWAAVIAVVCAVCAQRMTAAFAGFGAWVLLAILLPALLTAAVGLAAPVPSREHYIEALRDAGDQVNANRVQLLERFYDEHPQWRPARTALDKVSSSVSRLVRAVEQERVLATVEHGFESARQRRGTLLEQLAWLSPVTLTHEALARVAGNDALRHRVFVHDVQAHQLRLRAFFQERIQQAALRDEQSACPSTCLAGYGFVDFGAVPRFQASATAATPTSIAPVLGWALGLLATAVALTGLGAWGGGRRVTNGAGVGAA